MPWLLLKTTGVAEPTAHARPNAAASPPPPHLPTNTNTTTTQNKNQTSHPPQLQRAHLHLRAGLQQRRVCARRQGRTRGAVQVRGLRGAAIGRGRAGAGAALGAGAWRCARPQPGAGAGSAAQPPSPDTVPISTALQRCGHNLLVAHGKAVKLYHSTPPSTPPPHTHARNPQPPHPHTQVRPQPAGGSRQGCQAVPRQVCQGPGGQGGHGAGRKVGVPLRPQQRGR